MAPKQSMPVKDAVIESKMAKRFQDIVERCRKVPDSVRVNPDCILVHPRNRNGQQPNIPYIHRTLAANLMSQGFDPKRPHDGYLVEIVDPGFKKEVMEYNRMIGMRKVGLMPPIHDDMVRYAALGGNHLTITLRLFKHAVTSPITGVTFKASDSDTELKQVIELGHRYVILDGSKMSKDDCEIVSRWLNSDQDQNQASGSAQLLRTLLDICRDEMKKTTLVKVSNLISKFASQSVVKIHANVLGSYSKWVLELGGGEYCEEFLSFHAQHVNPTTLTVSPNWFEDLTKSIPRKFPLIRLATTIAQHCEDNVLMGIPPAPNTSRFISAGELAALGSNSSLADALESILRDEIRGKYEPYLKAKLGDAVARNWCMQLETQLIRLAFGKSLHPNYPGGVAGKFSKDKAVTLAKNWLIAIEKENECMDGSIYHFGFAEEGMEEESEVTKSIHTEQVQSV